MGVEMTGFLELTDEIERMAGQFVDAGLEGLDAIIRSGAEPILDQAKLNCPVRSGVLKDSLKIATQRSGSKFKARIGAQKGGPGFYATFVEYGHGGPRPAGPHPFLAPAFDAKKEDAYSIIKSAIESKLNL